MEPHLIPCPPELLGVAVQLESMTAPQRAAAAGVIYSALAGVLMLHPQAGTKPPLTSDQRAVIDHLREQGTTSAESLSAKIGYSVGTIRNWCTGPLREHGVIATRKGYAIHTSA